MASLNMKATLLSLLLLLVGLGIWEAMNQVPAASTGLSEYERMMGGADQEARVPPPSQVFSHAWDELSDPFYDAGPNDKGIGIQLAYSLYRVLTGYLAAALIAIPLGFVIGMSPLMHKALNPFIQVLRPISPLAWMPLALFIIRDSEGSAIFVIFICSIWPMLINTAFGVANVRTDWIKVARTHELSPLKTAFLVILPAAAPTILTGMRISIGIAWLVIVAAEMLVGGTGIGYYVWNEWNNLDLNSVIFSILMIGIVGMLLDMTLAAVTKLVQYED
ncbi:nitrate ABC transporter permease [Porticoccus sp.]|jgi:nitrate/nitrite transport system permease protein|uniref:nitrate ABC transporter permease n=1 Tax=Porticoccus sp. TaxID=2024853 RepID=UPI000C43823C|nr:nitrate ABC transporter permease [Porticoccus sp.]MAZ69515.1 nitrate ABC transporter, permease protein [Porticoccus sp.]|tara:strand:+ start:5087 stop:5914 length:828 start_codon:yes stop_codon:yes gene_type:complete